ncbi:MAG: hypothetical protein K0R57_1545 [Paenibacillaceae bacterium]|nr:hypothetical protein [Paenibacillaceae bacterium]
MAQNESGKNRSKPKQGYQNKHKTAEDQRVDGPNRPAE